MEQNTYSGADPRKSSLNNKSLITLPAACEYLVLSRATMYRLVESRRIPYFKLGKSIRFSPEKLELWLRAQEKPVIID